MAALRISGPDDGDWMEVRPQIHPGGRHVAGPLKVIERSEDRVVVYTRYDPGLVIGKGTPFGPIVAGESGTVLFESFDGETGHISEDYDGFLAILAERGMTILPEPDETVQTQGAGRASR